MPIILPTDLPAFSTLDDEGHMVVGSENETGRAATPIRIALLNLMPRKRTTETQFARLLAASSQQIELTLLTTCRRAGA